MSCVPRRVVMVRLVAFTSVAFRLTAAVSVIYVASEQSSQHTLAIRFEEVTGTLYMAYTGDASRLVEFASRCVDEPDLEICGFPADSASASSWPVALDSALGLLDVSCRVFVVSDRQTRALWFAMLQRVQYILGHPQIFSFFTLRHLAHLGFFVSAASFQSLTLASCDKDWNLRHSVVE